MNRSVDYSQVAGEYDRRYVEILFDGLERALLDFIGRDAGARVLEVGCGTGHWLALLQGRGLAVAGLDASAGMLERARARAPGAVLKQGHADRIPWEDGSFDRLLCVNAFHHFDDKDGFIAEARRVLRAAGGLMIIGLDPHAGLDRWCIYDYFEGTLDIDRRRYLPTARVEELMRAAGFSECRTSEAHRVVMWPPARAAIEKSLLAKTTISQLGVLTDAEYRQGIDRINAAIEASEAKGEVLVLDIDLRLYATAGWRRG